MISMTIRNRLIQGRRLPSIQPGLEARIHDPMWMLARQFQMGEFTGADAGSPIAVRMAFKVAPISRYRAEGSAAEPGAAGSRLFDAARQLLEPLVEGEAVLRRASPTPRTGADTGLRLLRMLRRAGLERTVQAWISAFPFAPLAPPANQELDPASQRYLEMMHNRVPDGRAVYAHFSPLRRQPLGTWTWRGTLSEATGDRNALQAVVLAWLPACEQHYDEPAGDQGSAWDPQRQEYRFAIAAHDGEQETVLAASEYHQGHLDWDAFRAGSAGDSLGAAPDDPGPLSSEQVHSAIPARLAYAGMPASRWWEMEDANVDFGAMPADSTDLVRMLFIDYALSFGNDWFLAPLELPYGSFSRVRSLVVTDVFGIRTEIPPVSEAADAQGWRMYTATGRDDGLLLAPVVAQTMEGPPLEDVRFLRDETANQAWAIELLAESPAGLPCNRHEASRAARTAAVPASGADGTLHYRLATTVADHWVPFLPIRAAQGLMLERGEMLPDPDPGGQAPTRILGRILEPERGEFRIFEEEVPRGGARVTRSCQYARGADNRPHLWVGRRKTLAQHGEARSGLRFDVIDAPR
ncbi:MAG: hypothetical protein ACREXK_10895 [Gammaproteobacteria bacterium]